MSPAPAFIPATPLLAPSSTALNQPAHQKSAFHRHQQRRRRRLAAAPSAPAAPPPSPHPSPLAPSCSPPSRRTVTVASAASAGDATDDGSFFLPAEGRADHPSRAPTAPSAPDAVPMSVAARRVANKSLEAAPDGIVALEEDDELRRSQIISEELSAADLFSAADLSDVVAAADDDNAAVADAPSGDALSAPLPMPDRPGTELSLADLSVSDLSFADLSSSFPNPQREPSLGQSAAAANSTEAAPSGAPLKSSGKPVRRRRKRRTANGPVKIASAPEPPPSQPSSASTSIANKQTSLSNGPHTSAEASSTSSSPLEDPDSRPSDGKTLTVGNLVRHERHGIGRFCGLERTRNKFGEDSGPMQEFLVIEYRDGDVYVPLSHLDAIERLSDVDAEGISRLDVIATSAYQNRSSSRRRANYLARRRTREKIRKQIVNLHAMYAQRTTLDRDPIPVNIEAEEEFSKECEFELTEDQHLATQQVFKDMSENRRPMDRLLCGDVGFGKTEVAIRAAFRALSAGMQVAVLAPTTILAQQHFETFRDRFAAHPEVKLACFTRFVSRRVVLADRDRIANGSLNLAIGTHMLLGENFEFNNLGLLIIDEEHRFGVNQKEKIRAKYQSTDTLFLSATPIPRTLHLSLSGLRDASVLRTPPLGRKPVITRTSRVGAGVVRGAIEKEMKRGGQLFYVVPRIEGIETTAEWLQELVHDLRVLVAHGGMNDLEQRILAFSRGEYDLLLCTTIIENGINMPDVNTIMIQDANKFGLAQLHQLRGRVGRSDVQAYAWIMYSDTQADNLSAVDRLKTLEEHSVLGSGFAIAQRDMEMRGVGTVLGVEQHGNNSMGAEEYAKMLAEELEHARTGEPIPVTLPKTENVDIFLPVASLIPEDYIADLEEKMMVYRRLAEAKSYEEMDKEVELLEEEKGEAPAALRRHVSILRVKMCAKKLGILKVWTERQHVILDWQVEGGAFKRLAMFLPDKQTRSRCEHLEAEERVVIRGLGICSGDVQLGKVLEVLEAMAKAAEGLKNAQGEKLELAKALDKWGGSSLMLGL